MEVAVHLGHAVDALLPHIWIHDQIEESEQTALDLGVEPYDETMDLVNRVENLLLPTKWMISTIAKQTLHAHERAPHMTGLDMETIATLKRYSHGFFSTACQSPNVIGKLDNYGLTTLEHYGIEFIVPQTRFDYFEELHEAVAKSREAVRLAEVTFQKL